MKTEWPPYIGWASAAMENPTEEFKVHKEKATSDPAQPLRE